MPVTAQLSEDDSSESDEDSVNFSNDARQRCTTAVPRMA